MHRLVAAEAERRPEALAVAWPSGSLRYGELHDQAVRLARRLQVLGVGPETPVGVCLERSGEEVATLLAVLYAGGAYVPLEPAHPADRRRRLLADCGARVVVTDPRGAGELSGPGVRAILPEAPEPAGGPVPDSGVAGGNLAYVIYTSGSTGAPKGVGVTHAGLANLVCWHREAFEVRPEDRASRLAGLAFDASVWELWPYLASGASIHLPPEEVRTSPGALRDWLAREEITLAFAPTPLAEALLASGDLEGTALRFLLTGGDRLHRHPIQPRPVLVNNYGPTECTVVTTSGALPVAGADGRLPRLPDIGRPISNVRVRLLDLQGRPVPAGEPGELCIGGRGLARGYLGDPARTAERFVPDPLAQRAGERLYRSGDRARALPDGRVEFLGRLDRQIKVRGVRIEPGEIEAALTALPGVRQAVVRVLADGPGPERLVAWVVPEPGRPLRAGELAALLRERLPEVMVPVAWVELPELPLTPNGKVDFETLPAPPEREVPEEAPRTPAEELLVQLWAEGLGLERAQTHDDFFALGGHSLLATRVASRISALLGIDLPVRELFEHPTPAALARRIEDLRQAGHSPLPPPRPVDRTRPLPLSFAQQRLWFLHQIEGRSPVYHVFRAYALPAGVDAGALGAALREVVRRHEALRTRFPRIGGEPAQEVSAVADLPLPEIDLRDLPREAREAEESRLGAEIYRRPFDLQAGPVLRAALLWQSATETTLLVGLHHIVTDGWSMELLEGELATLYAAFRDRRPSPLPEPPLQYGDFAVWQREWLQGEALEREVAFWAGRLAGAPTFLELPADRPRPPLQSFRGGQRSARLPGELSAAVERLGRREGATLFMTLLAAFEALLGRSTHQEDLLVGTPVANRQRIELEGVIGFFANTLVLRGELAGDPPFRELLARVRRTALDAYTHQDLPFEKLVEELRPERHLSHAPLVQVLFVLEEARRIPPAGGLELVRLPFEGTAARFDLTLLAERSGPGGISAGVEYAADLFDASTAARLLGHFQALLAAAVADPEARLSALELLAEAERWQLLGEWNDRRADVPADVTLDRRLALQAARDPDALALVFEEQRLTWRDLDERCNRLARHLRRQGVGPESIVALLLDRSVELVVAILGVLRAGGAYLPLDPAYPGERLAFMLRDARPALLLSTGDLSAAVAPEDRPPVLLLDAGRARIEAESGAPLAPAAFPESPAYVIYTSGSTGWPKGVQVTHRGLTNMAERQLDTFGLGPGDRVLQFSSPSFDASIFEVALALRAGAALYLAERFALLPGRGLVDLLRRERVSAVVLPPSVLAAVPEEELPDLACIIVAGEACPADLVARWAPGRRFWNAYGPTETTVWATVAACVADGRQPAIGRPIGNARAYVLDSRGAALPVGVPGQLCLGGVGLARGYLGRPDLTAERFVPDPFGGEPGGRLYVTGDLVRWLPSGSLDFLGRIDHQIKIRGFRIEPGEIEAALSLYPAVREAVVLARGTGSGPKRLVAYVVPRDGERLEAAELRGLLRERLPEYAVPAAFVILPELPLSPNGKVDRAALPEPAVSAPAGASRVAPRNELERLVATVWAEVLEIDEPGVHDNFFDVGGHSLLLSRVQERLETALGRPVPILDLFRYPTVRSLAERLGAGAAAEPAPLQVAPRDAERSQSAARRRDLRKHLRQAGIG